MNAILKRITAVFTVLILVLSLSGCGADSGKITWYDFNAVFKSDDDRIVAENFHYILKWQKETANVVLVSKDTGTEWSTIPNDAKNNTTQPNVYSPILLTYIESGTLNSSNANAYVMSVKNDSFSSELIDNGIQVTYYFEKIAVAVPVKYILREDSLQVTIDPDSIMEDENLVANISVMPFFCSINNTAEQNTNYLFVPSGSGALIQPQVIGEGITSIIEDQVYGDDEQITSYSTTNKAAVRLPVYGSKNGDKAICAIIEGSDSSANINTNVGSSTYGYSSVYASFNLRGSEISSSTYMGGLKNNKVLFCNSKSTEDMTVGFYPLYGENANYSGMSRVYKNYLINNKNLQKQNNDNILSLKFIGGVQVKKFTMGIPHTVLFSSTTFNDVANITKELESEADKISVNLTGFGNSGCDIGKVAGGLKYNSKFGSIKALKSLSTNENVAVYFDFDISHYSNSGAGIYKGFGTALSAIGGKNQKEYINLWSMEPSGTKSVYYLVRRSSQEKLVKKIADNSAKWEVDGISLNSFSSSSYSDYSDENYYVKLGYESQADSFKKALNSKKLKFAASGGNQYSALIANQIFDSPVSSSNYQVYSISVPFYQMVFKGYVPLSVPSINLSDNWQKAFLQAVETGAGLSYSLINNYDTDLLTAKQNVFYASVYSDNKLQIIKDLSQYKQVFSKVENAQITNHMVLSDTVRCSVFSNGVSIYVNYGDTEYTNGTLKVPANGFSVETGVE